MERAVHAIVTGEVQGVWFRDSTRREAERLGVSGSVRNCADGRVELYAAGDAERVRELLDWCLAGPPRARVEALATEELAADAVERGGFHVVG